MHLVYPDTLSLKKTLKYMTLQCFAGWLAALLSWWTTSVTFTLAPPNMRTGAEVMIVEAIFTTGLCLVVLCVATVKSTANNSYFGLAIGFTVLAAAFAIGPISGAVLNPAVCFGVVFAHLVHTGGGMEYLVIYFVSPLIASFCAAALFEVIWGAELGKSDDTPRRSVRQKTTKTN